MLALVAASAGIAGLILFTESSGDSNSVLDTPDNLIVHVHGLGIDPADDQLYAATHNGLYRVLDDNDGAFVGDNAQDTMGFTVVGRNHFLASGHPDLRSRPTLEERPLLGLIESTDAGRTWRERSLRGRADFHGLVAAHGLVYGWNATSGEFMVTSNHIDWEIRSPTVNLLSFAVDPAEPNRIIASNEDGILRSADGGRTWETASGPKNAFVSWGTARDVWAAQFDGAVLVSKDGGATWRARGKLPGPAEALLVHGQRIYAAAHGAGILVSTDGGRTWKALYRAPAN